MPVPKKRHSYSKKNMRRSHHALKKITLATCTNCGEPTLPHRICPNCNFYKGKRTVAVED